MLIPLSIENITGDIMAQTNITIRNDRTANVLNQVKEAIYDALDLCAQQAVRNAGINLEHDPRRIDTGLLRNSITYAHGGKEAAVSSYKANAKHGHTDSTERRGIAGTTVTNPQSGSYSGTAEGDANEVFIGTNVEYGIYVHEGTQKMSPNRYLRDAVQGHENEYQAICKQVFSNIR